MLITLYKRILLTSLTTIPFVFQDPLNIDSLSLGILEISWTPKISNFLIFHIWLQVQAVSCFQSSAIKENQIFIFLYVRDKLTKMENFFPMEIIFLWLLSSGYLRKICKKNFWRNFNSPRNTVRSLLLADDDGLFSKSKTEVHNALVRINFFEIKLPVHLCTSCSST